MRFAGKKLLKPIMKTRKQTTLVIRDEVVAKYKYRGCGDIYEVFLADSVRIVAAGAFEGCQNLRRVVCGSSLEKISVNAFRNCRRLEIVEFNEGLVAVGEGAFAGCINLREVKLPQSLKCLFVPRMKAKGYAIPFTNYGIEPDGYELTRNGCGTFEGCSSLVSITVPPQVERLPDRLFCGCINLQDAKIAGRVIIGRYTFMDCHNLVEADIRKARAIGYCAFKNCVHLSEADIPDGITVDEGAFENCSDMEYLRIGRKVEFGKKVFVGCTILKDIDYPEENTIMPDTFENCAMDEGLWLNIHKRILPGLPDGFDPDELYGSDVMNIPDGVTSVAAGAFRDMDGARKLHVPSSVRQLEDAAFANSSICSVQFENGLEYIGKRAFAGTGIKEVSLPEGLREIDDEAFANSALVRCYFPRGIRRIGDKAFEYTGLEQVQLNDGLERLGKGAFSNCRWLVQISFPNGLKDIPENACEDCRELKYVNLPGDLKTIGKNAFRFSAISTIALPGSLTRIETGAFAQAINLTDMRLHEGLKYVPMGAFIGSGLRKLDYPDSVHMEETQGPYRDCDKPRRDAHELPDIFLRMRETMKLPDVVTVPAHLAFLKTHVPPETRFIVRG